MVTAEIKNKNKEMRMKMRMREGKMMREI